MVDMWLMCLWHMGPSFPCILVVILLVYQIIQTCIGGIKCHIYDEV